MSYIVGARRIDRHESETFSPRDYSYMGEFSTLDEANEYADEEIRKNPDFIYLVFSKEKWEAQ